MLTAADVIAGKLLVQLGDVTAAQARAAMRAAAADDSTPQDLVARLQAEGLDQAKVRRIRRYVGLYEMVRAEAVYLTLLEKRHGFPRHEAHDLLARIEADVYRSRLGAALVEAGRLTEEEDGALVQRARQAMAAEDAKVVARYLRDDFEGVARPLVRAAQVTAASFTASTIFRSPETARLVKAQVERLRGLAEAVPGGGIEVDFAPPEAVVAQANAPGAAGLDLERLSRADTARIRHAEPEPAAGDLVGRRAIGPYEVVECLGQGGMGAVYLARDPESAGALVAVKVLQTGRAGPDDVARFGREVAVMRLVDHPDVVTLIDEGRTDDGLDYVVLQAFPGRPLRALLREGGPLPLGDGLRLLERLLEALAAVHAAGVVHRDVKPENVFVIAGPERAIKLLDLGIARRMDDDRPAAERLFRTRAGVISGSPAYVAPETITDDPIDGRTDVYSAGVLAFEALTGKLPLVAGSPYELLREHLLGVPLTLGQARKDVAWSPDLERLVARMLAKERDQRPTCAEVLDALRGGLAAEAVRHAKAPSPAPAPGGVKGLFKLLNRATWT
ncbi:MAG: serine/threonine protein kinase [Planctomycetes bacterium]|nr:serine/threonine protein kinase [Planctomycetota bacterium]